MAENVRGWTVVAQVLLLGVFYYVAAEIGGEWSTSKGIASPIWPAAGVAVAGILILGRHAWPAVFLATYLSIRSTDWPLRAKLGISVGNSLEAILAACVIRDFLGGQPWFAGVRTTVTFIVGGAILPAAFGASWGTLTVWWTSPMDADLLRPVFFSSWIGDSLGIMLVTPLVLVWSVEVRNGFPSLRWRRFAVCLLATLVSAWIVYFHVNSFLRHYFVYPAVLWATVEFAHLGAVTSLILVSAIGVWGTTLGTGPLNEVAQNVRFPLLQQFMGVTTTMMMVLAAVVRQRNENVEELAISNRVLLAEIRDRERAQAELAESENLFRAFFEQAAVGIAQVDMDGRFLQVNARLCEIAGLTQSELAERKLNDIARAADLAQELDGVEARLEDGNAIYKSERPYRRPDGSLIWIGVSVALVRNVRGKEKYFVSVVEEITERKKAEADLLALQQQLEERVAERTRQFEQANRDLQEEVAQHQRTEWLLQEQTDILEAVLDGMTECVVVADAAGNIIVMNLAAQRLHGGPTRQGPDGWSRAFGIYLLDGETICPTEELPLVRAIRGEPSDERELVLLPPSRGVRVRICVTGRTLRNAKGEIRGGVVVFRDVTASREAEEALYRSEQRLKLALENARLGTWDWRIATGECYLDDRWLGMLDYLPNELPHRIETWERTLHPEDLASVWAILKGHLESDDALYDVEYRGRKKNGEWIWINSRGRVQERDAEGRALRMMGTVQDISARKSSEERILASLREKEVLLREIHHRVKNNLAIVSSLFYLQEGYVRDEEIRRLLRECRNRVRSMALVHEFLYRSENLAAVRATEYLASLTRHLWDSFGSMSARVQLLLEIEPVTLTAESAIPCGLIVNELITNCLKHAFPEGRSGTVILGMHKDERGDCVLRVADNGRGVPPDVDLERSQSLGVRLVRTLSRQIEGKLVFLPAHPGTEVLVTFPLGGGSRAEASQSRES